MKETVQAEKPRLQRPVDRHRVMATLEGDTIHVAGLDGELAKVIGKRLVKGEPAAVPHKGGVVVSGTFAGASHTTGSVIVTTYPDGRAKVMLFGHTSPELAVECAQLIFAPDTMEPFEAGAMTFKGQLVPAIEVIAGDAAKLALEQKVSIKPLENGVKVRIVGSAKGCEAMRARIIKGNPTESSGQGAGHKIEGNLYAYCKEKGPGNSAPDQHGVITRDDSKERMVSAFGDNLVAVKAAIAKNCKSGTEFFFVLEGTGSVGARVVGFGKKLQG